jgi:hypothetical protein
VVSGEWVMNCAMCRRVVMQSEEPEQPPVTAAAHLAECLACRQWQQRLLLIEGNIARLPVPRVGPRAVPPFFVEPELPAPRLPSPPTKAPAVRRVVPRWAVHGAGSAVAASVLIGCGVLLGNYLLQLTQPAALVVRKDEKPTVVAHKPVEHDETNAPAPVAPDPRPQRLALAPVTVAVLAGDLALAKADSPRQRVQELAKIAQALQGETSALARAGATRELDKMAGLCSRVIRDGVMVQAHALPDGERRQTLTRIAGELARTGDLADGLAMQAPAAARSLRDLAATARDGDSQLRRLIGEGAK